jgi:hypothetical protein
MFYAPGFSVISGLPTGFGGPVRKFAPGNEGGADASQSRSI